MPLIAAWLPVDHPPFSKTWFARAPSVAVSTGADGKILGIAAGEATIFVSIAGFIDSMTVTVK